jgi:hypothetical protein
MRQQKKHGKRYRGWPALTDCLRTAAQRVGEAAISFAVAHWEARAGIVDTFIASTAKKMECLIMRSSKLLLRCCDGSLQFKLISRTASRLRYLLVQKPLSVRARRFVEYPPRPYRFVNREYRTDPAKLRAVTPEPLEFESAGR